MEQMRKLPAVMLRLHLFSQPAMAKLWTQKESL
jgi:hypothetical protein